MRSSTALSSPVSRGSSPTPPASESTKTDLARRDPRPPPHPGGHQRADAGHAARLARPDDRVDRAADDRQGARRARAPLVGGHGVSARGDGGDAAVRQARRPLRPQDRAPGRAGAVPRGVGAVRPGPGDDRADRVPGDPGPGRRRADGQRAGGDRRRRPALRARQVHRALRRGLRRLGGRRPAPGRVHDDPYLVALDLLREPAARHPGPRRAGGHAAVDERAPLAQDRLRGHGAAGARPERDHPADDAGREHVRVELGRRSSPWASSASSAWSRCPSSSGAPPSRSCRPHCSPTACSWSPRRSRWSSASRCSAR